MTTPPPPPPAEPSSAEDERWPEDPVGWRHDAGGPEDAFPVPFGMLDGFGLVLWSLIAIVVVSIIGAALGVSLDNDLGVLGLTLTIQTVVIAGSLLYLRRRGSLTWHLLGPRRPRAKHVAIGAGIGVVGLVIFLAVATMANDLLGPFPDPDQSLLRTAEAGPLAIVLLVLGSVVFAPASEELIFRSVLFQSTRSKFGVVAGLVVSSVLWGYVHTTTLGSPHTLMGLIALGLWLAGAFHRTGSLVVPLVGHATYNALVVALQLVAGPPPS